LNISGSCTVLVCYNDTFVTMTPLAWLSSIKRLLSGNIIGGQSLLDN